MDVGILLSDQSAGYAFERIDEFGDTNFRRIIDEEVYMIHFAFEFNEFGFKIATDFRKNNFQGIQMFGVKAVSAVFCDKDKVDMHEKSTMSTAANFT